MDRPVHLELQTEMILQKSTLPSNLALECFKINGAFPTPKECANHCLLYTYHK